MWLLRSRTTLFWLALTMLAQLVAAQELDQSTYRIRPGDEIEISIFSLPQQERKYTVRADGMLYHPLMGALPVAGKTLDDIRAEIRRRLTKRINNPSFEVGLLTYAKSEVAVLGEVRSQGRYPIERGATVLDVLALAGGLSEKADPHNALLQRRDKNVIVDLGPPSGTAQPIPILPGDILYVYAGNRISVAGEVQKPGIYAVSRTSQNPVADAIKAAGGVKSTAAVHRVKLQRATLPEPLVIRVVPDAQGGMQSEALSLQDGDTLVVPERQAMVLGEISKQGPIPLQGGEKLLDVLTASGVAREADLGQIIVVRAEDVQAGQNKHETYDVTEALTSGNPSDAAASVKINDGDVVFVPQRGKGIFDSMGLFNLLFLVRSIVP
ncbi:MAG: hypothetical protein AMXMBFR33_12540 [Candidatus Xenobia bacterium]